MTEREQAIQRLQKNLQGNPVRGMVFRHYKGGLYVVLARSLSTDDNTALITYQHIETGHAWTRPLWEWLDQVDDDGTTRLRFEATGNTLGI